MKIAFPYKRISLEPWFLISIGLVNVLIAWGLLNFTDQTEVWYYLPLGIGTTFLIFGIVTFFWSSSKAFIYHFMFFSGLGSMGMLAYWAWIGEVQELFFPLYFSIHLTCSLLLRKVWSYFAYATLVTAVLILGFFWGGEGFQLELVHWGIWFLLTMIMAYYHLWHENNREDKRLHFHLFQEMLDQSSRAMFLLELDEYKILSINKPGLDLLEKANLPKGVNGSQWLEKLGFNLTYLNKRFTESNNKWEEKSYYQLGGINGSEKIELEIVLRKINSNQQSFLLLRIQDVTGLRAKDRNLERSLSLNKSMIGAIPDMLVTLDAENKVQSFHIPSGYPSFAYNLFENKPFESFLVFLQIEKVDQASIMAALEQIKQEEKLFQLYLDAKVGENVFNFELRLLALGIQGETLCMFRNISDQVALEHTENRYKTLVENMNEGLVMTDREEKVLFINRQMVDILETSTEKVLGKKSFEIFGNEEAHQKIISKTGNRKKGIVEQYELELWLHSNKKKQLLIAAVPYLDRQEQFLGTIAIITDISERKETEHKLKEKKYELDSFMYKASHDLKGPIASIIGITNIAQQEVADSGALRYFDLVTQSAKKLDTILSELINLTRINNAELELKNLDLKQLVDEVVEILRYHQEAEKMKFNIQLQHDAELISDKSLLHSIIQNLIYNSILYRNVSIQNPTVSVISSDYRDGIKICVRDNGIGIPKRIQERVFEMFYRGSNQSKGSGLGLYIVKSAVEKLGGKIELVSHVDIGSEFILYLPKLNHNLK